MVRSIGADDAVDYTREDVTERDVRFDAIVDTVSTHPIASYRRILTPDGRYATVGSLDMGDWLGPIAYLLRIKVASIRGSQTMSVVLAKQTTDDLAALAEMLASGAIRPVIDRTYPLESTPDAIAHLEGFHARGKVVLTV